MSFGFSVGDFFTTIQLANKIRREFVDSPSQFKAVADEVRTLSIVLQDADVALSNRELNNEQKNDLDEINQGCRNVLEELQRILDKNIELSSEGGDVGKKMKRVWKRLNWKPEDITQLRGRISSNISLLNLFNGRLTHHHVSKLIQYQEDQGRKSVLDWLTQLDYATQQNDFVSRWQAGTGQWLLNSAKFQSWVKTDQEVLFCPGIPGAGKTILTSIVVDYLSATFQKDTNVGIAYLYCNFRRKDEQKVKDLIASLLKQLTQGLYSLPESVRLLYDKHKGNRTQPTTNEISSTLQSVGSLYSKIFIVIDALDECQTSDGCRMKFLDEIFAFQMKCGANIFITSRFIPEITEQFKDNLYLEIRASDPDVRRCLDGHMSQLSRCVLSSSELQDEIKASIIKSVDGIFLLAQLHFDSLKGKASPKAIRTALKNLSTGYDQAYDDAMTRIEGQLADEKQRAKQVLSWITCATRPLITSELEYALAIELGESQFNEDNLTPLEDMVSVCAGLVIVDEESRIVRLVHYTTQEYFERKQKIWFPDAETNIASICVTYLSFDIFKSGICQNDQEFEERLQSKLFYNYASHNWGHHARKASTLIPQVISFLDKDAQVEASCQALLAQKLNPFDPVYSQRFPRQITRLHLAAHFGVWHTVNSFLETGLAAHSKDSNGTTSVTWAAKSGYEAVARLLLDNGAEVDSKDHFDRTPLWQAAWRGHEAVVKLLLEKDAEVDSKDKFDRTPLSLAAEGGHDVIVRLLLDRGAEIESKDEEYGQTPLSRAAESGHEAVVRLLLEKGAEIESKDNSDGTPLCQAVWRGHEAVVKLLLDKGAEVDSIGRHSQTLLLYAAGSGHEAVVRQLLDKGAEVDLKFGEYGQTPLALAAEYGYEAIVGLLLDKGADIDSKDKFGRTPLWQAVWCGHGAVVVLLLDKGAEVDSNYEEYGQTPLSLAAEGGHDVIVRLLLDRGAEIESKDEKYGQTPLSRAAEYGHEAVVRLLLEKGAEMESKDNSGRTPLWWAATKDHKDVEQLLSLHGALPVEDLYGLVELFTL